MIIKFLFSILFHFVYICLCEIKINIKISVGLLDIKTNRKIAHSHEIVDIAYNNKYINSWIKNCVILELLGSCYFFNGSRSFWSRSFGSGTLRSRSLGSGTLRSRSFWSWSFGSGSFWSVDFKGYYIAKEIFFDLWTS